MKILITITNSSDTPIEGYPTELDGDYALIIEGDKSQLVFAKYEKFSRLENLNLGDKIIIEIQ